MLDKVSEIAGKQQASSYFGGSNQPRPCYNTIVTLLIAEDMGITYEEASTKLRESVNKAFEAAREAQWAKNAAAEEATNN